MLNSLIMKTQYFFLNINQVLAYPQKDYSKIVNLVLIC